MITKNSIIFPDNIIKNVLNRPVAKYVYKQKSIVEQQLVKFVIRRVDNMKYKLLCDILLKGEEGKVPYVPHDSEGEPLLGKDENGKEIGTDVIIVKRMNSQLDKHDIFEARIELETISDYPRISKRLYFGLSVITKEIRIYTHFQDKTLSKSREDANALADELADECGFGMENIDSNHNIIKKEPLKTYLREGIDYEKIG
ncbi:hypothetical protein [Leuconostoc mesenteroides]|uniref:hypothetical protein n=1 Tax=Leuconostoc mesenteroides TaxID=1245 RepID=UPI001CBC19FA|nr:hypothetical protein [Leuconostoc mesenteroides]MBZ1509186.1 hypothetical protein [Leuconostoc mesenteroides]MBZ1533753.1 hypothetical protein [Leuconostoc mesenteroides]